MNIDLSFAYYSTEAQISQTVKAQAQAVLSGIYDFMCGCFHNIPVNNYKVYLKANNESPLTQGVMDVHMEFADRKNPIGTKRFTYTDFNNAGQYGVEVFDFEKNIDAKVIFKIRILTDFDNA